MLSECRPYHAFVRPLRPTLLCRRHARWAGLLALGAVAVLGAGCASVRELVSTGQFDRACIATRSSDAREATAEAITQRTDATIHIRALSPDEIKRDFGSSPLDAHSLLLHVTTDAHVAPNQIDIQVLFVRGDRVYAGPAIWSGKQLAKLLADLRGHQPLDGSWPTRCGGFPEAPDCAPPSLP